MEHRRNTSGRVPQGFRRQTREKPPVKPTSTSGPAKDTTLSKSTTSSVPSESPSSYAYGVPGGGKSMWAKPEDLSKLETRYKPSGATESNPVANKKNKKTAGTGSAAKKSDDLSQGIRDILEKAGRAASDQIEGGEELRESASVIYAAATPARKAKQTIRDRREKQIQKAKQAHAVQTVSYRPKSVTGKREDGPATITYTVQRKQMESRPVSTNKKKKKSDPRYSRGRDRRRRKSRKRRRSSSKKATPIGLRERLIHAFRVRDAEEDSADVAGDVTKGAKGLKRIILLILHVIKTIISVILLPVFIVIAIVIIIIALIVGIILLIIYCSPLSIFFPHPDTGTPDIRAVLSGYYQEFNAQISSYEAQGDTVTFLNSENGTFVSNFKDTLMVYMTLYSDGTTGFVMDENGQANLKKVFDEMNYIERGRSERQIKVGESLGKVYVTAYCPCRECSGRYGHSTASGHRAKPNHTIAVDAYDPIVPMGTKVVIEGKVYTVEDTGDLHKYGNEFDIFYEHHSELDSWGRRKVEVFIADKDGNIKKPDNDGNDDSDHGEPEDNGSQSGDTEGRTVKVSSEGIIVHNLTYKDYIAAHTELNDDQKKMMELLMTEDSSIYGGGSGIGEQVVALGMTKLGCQYSQARRYDEGYYDCSSFVMRLYAEFGLELPGTAASQGQFCAEHGMIINQADLRPGDLIFYSYEKNDRYKNISHVAIYAGDGKMIHAANPRRGVVMDPIRTGSVVFFGRPYIG